MTFIKKNSAPMISVLLIVGLIWFQQTAISQTSQQAKTPGSNVLSTGGGQALIDPSDTGILLLDHQTGLFQTVKDISVSELRANTSMLAKLATLLKIPVITSASEPNGPNGPLMPKSISLHSTLCSFPGKVKLTRGTTRISSTQFGPPVEKRSLLPEYGPASV